MADGAFSGVERTSHTLGCIEANMEFIKFGHIQIKPDQNHEDKNPITIKKYTWYNLSDNGGLPSADKNYAGLVIYHNGGTYRHAKDYDMEPGSCYIMDIAQMVFSN